MSRLLSREELEALWARAAPSQTGAMKDRYSSGDRKSGRAIPYDFRHPNRVSKDQIRRIETIHDGFAGTLATSLSTTLRSLVDVDLAAVDQITYTEFITALSSPSCSYTFRMSPLDGTCVLDVDRTVALAILDRLFGGRGTAMEAPREMTKIERTVMQRMAARALDQLAECWHRVTDVTAAIMGLETNPQFLQAASPGETVIAITLQFHMDAARGRVRICYPYVMLESALARLSAQSWTERARTGRVQTDRASVLRMLRSVPVTIEGQLTETLIPLGKLMELQRGTIIPLPLRIGEAVTIKVAGEKKFAGTLGTVGRRRAVRIEGPLQSEGG